MLRKYVALSVAVMFLGAVLSACATSERTYQAGAAGGAIGAATGILLDKNNRWRGALLGAGIGALLGGTVTEIATRASREAAQEGRTVAYESEDGFHRVQATPGQYNRRTGCRMVREQVYQDGRLVREQIREICDAPRQQRAY